MTLFSGRTTRCAFLVVCLLTSMFFVCGLAFAAEGGGHGGAHDSERLWDLGYRFLNFALLVIILFVVVRKTAIKDFFSDRREQIRIKFEELKGERRAAESRSQELEKKLKELEKEKKEIIGRCKAEGIAEKEKIVAEAEERAAQILAQADLAIGREIRAARDRLVQEVVDIASKRAEEMIVNEVQDSDQDQFVDEFVKRVENLH